MYISQPGNRFEHKKSGYYRENSERDEIRGKENSVHVWLKPGENQFYIRYQNQLRIGVAPNVRLQPVERWNEYIIERNLYEGIAQGVLLVLFLYNFLLYFTLKRKTYLYYSLYILALSVFYLCPAALNHPKRGCLRYSDEFAGSPQFPKSGCQRQYLGSSLW